MVYSLGNANVYYWNKCFLHYSYALVLKAPAGQDVPDMLVQIVTFLRRAGLRLCFLREDSQYQGFIIVLITAEPYHEVVRNYHEFKRVINRGRRRSASNDVPVVGAPLSPILSPSIAGAGAGAGAGASPNGTAGAEDAQRPLSPTAATRQNITPPRRPPPGRGPFVCGGMDQDGLPSPTATTLLQRENVKLYNERYLKFGMQGTSRVPPDFFDMTTAKKLMLTHRLVVAAIDRVNLENHNSTSYSHSNRNLVGSNHELLNTKDDAVESAWDYVEHLFPLQDEQWNLRFVRLYMKSLFQWQRWVPSYLRQFMREIKLKVNIRQKEVSKVQRILDSDSSDDESALKQLMTADAMELFGGVEQDWAMLALREHMGERCAFYFAFMQHYSAYLGPLALLMTLMYLCVRWVNWGAYIRALTLVGLCVPAVWAPMMILQWRRRSNALALQWDLRGAHEAENPNERAYFKRVVVNAQTGETNKVYDPNNNRARIRWCLPLMLLLNLSIMIVTIAPFAQWYSYGRMAPLCSCCEWHQLVGTNNRNASVVPPLPSECEIYKPAILEQDPPSTCTYFINCFHVQSGIGLRKFYLGFQGALLGAWLDMFQFEQMKKFTTMLTNLEHWPTEAQYYNSLISKQFVFCWVNMYFFFLSLAFVYVPFGRQLQDILQSAGLGFAVPMYGWLEGTVNLDEAILGPLVFAQMTNLMMETVIPYARLKCRRRKKLPTVMSFKISHLIPKAHARRPPTAVAAAVASDVTSPVAKPVASSDTDATDRVAQSKSSRNLLKSADELEASVYDALHGFDSQQRLVAVGADEAKPSRPDARGWGKQPKGAARHHQRMDQVGLDGHAVGVDAAESASREAHPVHRLGPSVDELEAAFRSAIGDDGASSSGMDVTASSSEDDPDAVRQQRRSSAARARKSNAIDSIARKLRGSSSQASMTSRGSNGSRRSSRRAGANSVKPPSVPGLDTAGTRDARDVSPLTVHVVGFDSEGKVNSSLGVTARMSEDGSVRGGRNRRTGNDDDDTTESSGGDDSDSSDELRKSATHRLAIRVRDELGRAIKIMRHTRDFNRVDAEEVMAQAGMKDFHPKDDFLDMVKQYGLVLMFSIAWALAPLAAFLNNVVEVRFDAFKILLERRRPVPREDVGIGGWLDVFEGSIKLALPIVAGLAVVATGGLEWWLFDKCHVGWNHNDARMVPDWECLAEEWGFRLLVAVVLERAGVMIVNAITSSSPYHASTLAEIKKQDAANMVAVQHQMLPGAPTGLVEDLEFLFEQFDANNNGVLNRDELANMLQMLAPRTLSDLDVSIMLAEADGNESNTITVMELAHAIRKLQDDDLLAGVVAMHHLEVACRALANGIRDGKVKVQGDTLRSSEAGRRFRHRVRAFIHGDLAILSTGQLSSRHLNTGLRQRSYRTARARPVTFKSAASDDAAAAGDVQGTILEGNESDMSSLPGTPAATTPRHSVASDPGAGRRSQRSSFGERMSAERRSSRLAELRKLQEEQKRSTRASG